MKWLMKCLIAFCVFALLCGAVVSCTKNLLGSTVNAYARGMQSFKERMGMAAPGQEAPNAVAPVAGLTQQPPETPPAPKTPPAKPAPLKFSAAAAPPPHKSHPSSKPKVKKRPNRAIPQTEPSASPRETDEVKEWEIYPPQDSLWAPEAEKETAK